MSNLEFTTYKTDQEHLRRIQQDEELQWLETEKMSFGDWAKKVTQDFASFVTHLAENQSRGGFHPL